MPFHQVERVLPYSPEQLFTLVGDVERYPEFVPWVKSLRAAPPQSDFEGIDHFDAEATVNFAFLTERFTTTVWRDAVDLTVEVGLVSGPFKRLANHWRFVPHARGTEVIFTIDFAFKRRILDVLLAANFNLAVDRLIACFEARAAVLYDAASGPGVGRDARGAAA